LQVQRNPFIKLCSMPMDTIINMKKQNEKRGQFLSAVEQPRILAYYPEDNQVEQKEEPKEQTEMPSQPY
nr:hypothetical protein [Clostridiales bacterium]